MRKRNLGMLLLWIVVAAGATAALLGSGCGSDDTYYSFTCTYCLNGAFYDCSASREACDLAYNEGDPSLCIRNAARDPECT